MITLGELHDECKCNNNHALILENVQNVDIVMFADAIRYGDYDSSLDNSGIRSSIGIGLDWLTPIGPLTFHLSTNYKNLLILKKHLGLI